MLNWLKKLLLTAEEAHAIGNFKNVSDLNDRKVDIIHGLRANLTDAQVDIKALNERADDLLILARGCKDHPSYRAIMPPQADCLVCNDLFRIAEVLREDGVEFKRANARKRGAR